MPTGKQDNGRLGETVWAAMRDEYVTGNESYAQIAKRYDVGKTAVQRHALDRDAGDGRTWSEWRAEFLDAVSGASLERAKKQQIRDASLVGASQRRVLQEMVDAAVPPALEALRDSEKIDPRDRVKLALAAIGMQRRVHGLDRTLEIVGKDGEAIDLEIHVDPVVDAAAKTVLEAALGRKP